ncbi:hypothetical protein EOL70_14005 [Leucothrix sargassi]|nr:hypothetical protein EOL70_14005 [Leucothrix sargassi]
MSQLTTSLSAQIVVSSDKVWRWQSELVDALTLSGLIQVSDVISNQQTSLKESRVISVLHKLDGAIFRSPLNSFELVSAQSLTNEPNSAVGADLPDIIINFSEEFIDKALLEKCRLGVVDMHFGAVGQLSSQYLAVKEYLHNKKQVSLALLMTNSNAEISVLSELKPSLDKGSLTRNMTQYFRLIEAAWKRSLSALANDAAPISESINKESTVSTQIAPNISLGDIARLAQRFTANVASKLSQKYRQTEQWVLLLQMREASQSAEQPLSFDKYIELIPPADVFWADPFVVSEAGKHYVFFEELPFATEVGHLSCMKVFPDGSYSQPKVILKQPYHLSFPNVFKHDGEYYMIPETGDHGAIELYHCTDFPYQWERKHTLINDIHAYDSTLLARDGKWWLFATVAAEAGMSGNEELHIFYADSPTSNKWQAHRANPVISDASCARPAGQIFEFEGESFRPSQDCAGHYGAGLNINKIIRLSTDEYAEELVTCCRPDWKNDLIALHTLNFNQKVAVADALRVTSKGVF